MSHDQIQQMKGNTLLLLNASAKHSWEGDSSSHTATIENNISICCFLPRVDGVDDGEDEFSLTVQTRKKELIASYWLTT